MVYFSWAPPGPAGVVPLGAGVPAALADTTNSAIMQNAATAMVRIFEFLTSFITGILRLFIIPLWADMQVNREKR
jgi:hypothetical protein